MNIAKCLEPYKTNQKLRKKYYLHTCKNAEDHLWQLEVPPGYKKMTVMNYYKLDLNASFPKKAWGDKALLMWECLSCEKLLVTKPKICKKCGRAVKPISKKMEKHAMLYLRLKCRCNPKHD